MSHPSFSLSCPVVFWKVEVEQFQGSCPCLFSATSGMGLCGCDALCNPILSTVLWAPTNTGLLKVCLREVRKQDLEPDSGKLLGREVMDRQALGLIRVHAQGDCWKRGNAEKSRAERVWLLRHRSKSWFWSFSTQF